MAPSLSIILVLLKATCLLLIALCATLAMQRASARSRHVVWLVALGALLVLPALGAWGPLELRVLPATEQAAGDEAAGRQVAGAQVAGGQAAPAPPTDNTGATVTTPRTSASLPFGWTLLSTLLAIWATVAVALLAWLGWGAFQVGRIVRRAEALTDPAWQASLYEIADRLGLDTAPLLLRSEDVKMPFAAGLVSPTIVLPASSDEWNAERRTAVLIHELGHVRRHDLVGHTLGRIACALYWFHPLVWTAARHLRAESERACDDLALAFGTRPSEYAEHLLDIVTCVRDHATPSVALALAHRKEFEGRMLAILNPDLRRKGMGRTGTALLVTSLLLLAVVVGGAMPVERPAPSVGRELAGEVIQQQPSRADDASQAITAPPVAHESPAKVRTKEKQQTRVEVSSVQAVAQALATSETRSTSQKSSATDSTDDERATVLARALRNDSDPSVRRIAAWGLAQYAEVAVAADALVAAVNSDADESVREMAAWALASANRSPAVIQALSKAASQDSNLKLKSTAVWALGSMGSESSIDVLVAAMSSSDPKVRAMAAWGIGNADPGKAPPALTKALSDSDANVRKSAAWALFNIQDPSTLPALEAAFAKETDPAIQADLIRAIGATGEASVDALSRLVSSPDARIRNAAVTALAGGGAGGPWPMPKPQPRPNPH
jgi:beta-lactamase regulating signal transducer with metallopeptidase domain/HEAT repeat protein